MGKLAMNGGKKVRIEEFPGWPVYDKNEERLILEVLRSGNWWRGPEEDIPESKVRQFEIKFAQYHKAKYGIAVTNGTAAIEIALKAAGIGAGDEVIVPAYTFIATATAVLTVNAVPVFVDINPETYCIDPAKMKAAITDRTKAVIPVHFAGNVSDMDRIMDIAGENNLLVVEDCAQAHGSKWKAKGVGSIGDMGTFSFQQSKTMTAGEGGIIITDSEDLAKKCYSYHHIGRIEGRPFYEHHRLAGNERMTEWQAAILLAQLDRLEEQTKTRDHNARHLTKLLSSIPGIEALKEDERVSIRGYYIYIFKYFKGKFKGLPRKRFIEALNAEGIPCHSGYPLPLYDNPLFREGKFSLTGCPLNCKHYAGRMDYSRVHCPETERAVYEEQVWIDQQVLLGTEQDMQTIAEAIVKIRENVDELL